MRSSCNWKRENFAFGPAATQLDLLETVDDLVEVENELSSVRDEEPLVALETCPRINEPV
jgi:hypothetical protein